MGKIKLNKIKYQILLQYGRRIKETSTKGSQGKAS